MDQPRVPDHVRLLAAMTSRVCVDCAMSVARDGSDLCGWCLQRRFHAVQPSIRYGDGQAKGWTAVLGLLLLIGFVYLLWAVFS